jgi:hypothetical protein
MYSETETYYFVEHLTYSNSYDSMPGNPWDTNPAINSSYDAAAGHMNWGWGGTDDGWYYGGLPSDVSYLREDFHVIW